MELFEIVMDKFFNFYMEKMECLLKNLKD